MKNQSGIGVSVQSDEWSEKRTKTLILKTISFEQQNTGGFFQRERRKAYEKAGHSTDLQKEETTEKVRTSFG